MGLTGYRLFAVSVHDGAKQDYRAFDDLLGDGKNVDYVKTLGVDLVPQLTKLVKFAENSSDETIEGVAQAKGSCLRFTHFSPVTSGQQVGFEFKFDQGVINSDGVLVDPGEKEEDRDLANYSTVYGYRGYLTYLPGGERALLAVEARGRSCPYEPLRRALKNVSANPWRIRVHDNLADLAAVRQYIRSSSINEVRLRSSGFDRDGQPAIGEATLSVEVISERIMESLKRRMIRWAEARLTGLDLDSAAECTAVAAEVSGDATNLEFDEAVIKIDGNHSTKTLGPNSDFRRFVYDLGPNLVRDPDFYSAVRTSCKAIIDTVEGFTRPEDDGSVGPDA